MIDRVLSKDTLIKWAAVILALVVWLRVYGDRNPVEVRVLNFELVVAAPEGKTLMNAVPSRVAVTFEGRERSLNRLNQSQIKIELDLSLLPDGVSVIPIEYESPDSSVSVRDVNPKELTVDLDTISTKNVQIGVVARGTPNDEYEEGQPQVVQASVNVTGAKRLVDKVQYVGGEVDISGARADVSATVTLSPKNAQGEDVSGIELDPATVVVTVPLTQRPPSKSVPVKYSVSGTPKHGYQVGKVTVTPSTVRFRATAGVAGEIDSVALARAVDVSGRDASFTQNVPLQIPPNVIYEGALQVSVRVEILEDIVQKTFTIPVQPRNVGVQLRWDISPVAVKVVLGGRSDVMEGIRESDIEAYVDAEGLAEGIHNPVVAATFPSNVQLVEVTPSHVELELKKR